MATGIIRGTVSLSNALISSLIVGHTYMHHGNRVTVTHVSKTGFFESMVIVGYNYEDGGGTHGASVDKPGFIDTQFKEVS